MNSDGSALSFIFNNNGNTFFRVDLFGSCVSSNPNATQSLDIKVDIAVFSTVYAYCSPINGLRDKSALVFYPTNNLIDTMLNVDI